MPLEVWWETLQVGVHHVSQERAVAGSVVPPLMVRVDSEDEM